MSTYKKPHCTAAEWRAIQEQPHDRRVRGLPEYIRLDKDRKPSIRIYDEFVVFTCYPCAPLSAREFHILKETFAEALGVRPAAVDGPYVTPLTADYVDLSFYVEPKPARKGGKGNEEAD